MQNVLSLLQTGLRYSEIMGMTLTRFNYVCEQLESMHTEPVDSQIQRVLKDPAIRKL